MQQLQQRSYAPPPPLNAGFAYRVRDSDVNVSGGFSQGRGQLQVSAVDDDTLMEGDPALVTAPSHGTSACPSSSEETRPTAPPRLLMK